MQFLANELRPLTYWPEQTTIKLTHIGVAKKYPSWRCSIDCTKAFIDRPRNLELQALTRSDYKKLNTAKLLIAIAPNRIVSFMSNEWGDRASDRHIIANSGFLDFFEPRDVLVADCGFPVHDKLEWKFHL
jgi:hypothetical protein